MLWGLVIGLDSRHVSLSLLLFALAMGMFFFLTLKRAHVLLYIGLSAVICLHGLWLTDESLFTLLLLLFMTIMAGFRLPEKALFLYIGIHLGLSVLVSVIQGNAVLEMIIMTGFFYFLVISLNRIIHTVQEKQAMYEQLLGEYRKLKRMNLTAEREARLEERTKIARDIHDSVGHRLTALIMKLEVLAIQHEGADYKALKQMAQDSLNETRAAVKALEAEE